MRPALHQLKKKTKTKPRTSEKGKNQALSEYKCKNLQTSISKSNPEITQRVIQHDQVGFFSVVQSGFEI